jgi:hypothetical protein
VTSADSPKPVVKLNLFGVVLRDGEPRAYLEDPTTKRVAGYRVGDAVGGGSVQAIAADHVVIARSGGTVDVQLRDPSRPRPAPPVAASGQPGAAAGQSATSPGALPAPGEASSAVQGTPPVAARGPFETGAGQPVTSPGAFPAPGVVPPSVQGPTGPPAPGPQTSRMMRRRSQNLLHQFPQGSNSTQQ